MSASPNNNPCAAPHAYGPTETDAPVDVTPVPPQRKGFEPFYLWLLILGETGSVVGRVAATELFGDRAVVHIIVCRILGLCLGAALFALLLHGRNVRAEERAADLS